MNKHEAWRKSFSVMQELRERRLEEGISQEDLADACSMSRPPITYYERGHRSPTLQTLFLLSDALGYDLQVTFRPKEGERG